MLAKYRLHRFRALAFGVGTTLHPRLAQGHFGHGGPAGEDEREEDGDTGAVSAHGEAAQREQLP
jgi:hypothetical protein